MKDIKSIIRLNCDEELDIKYFAKDDSIYETTIDYGELLDYINEIEDENDKLQDRIDNAIKLIEEDYFEDGSGENIEKVLEILKGSEQE